MTQQLEHSPAPGEQATATGSKGWSTPIRVVAAIAGTLVLLSGTASAVGFFMIRNDTKRVYFYEPVTRVQVAAGTGDVEVRVVAAGESTSVISRSSSSFTTARHSEKLTDGLLSVRGSCHGTVVVSDFCSVDFEISVPAGTAVKINTGSGDVTVRGTGASVTAETGTGDISLKGIDGSREPAKDAGGVSGAVTPGGTISTRTGTGDIELDFATAPIRVTARAGTGDIDVRVPNDRAAYRIDASTSTGDRQLDVPTASESDRTMTLRTNTGDIDVRKR